MPHSYSEKSVIMAASPSFMKDIQLNTARQKYSETDGDLRLRQAAAVGDLGEVLRLLRSGQCRVDAAQKGTNPETGKPYTARTALHTAAMKDHEAVAVALMSAGWSLFLKDSDGNTPQDYVKSETMKQHLLGAFVAQSVNQGLKSIFNSMQLEQKLPDTAGKPLRVISLACGIAADALALHQLYPDKSIEFVGIDNDDEQIADSKRLCVAMPGVRIVKGDATDLKWLQNNFTSEGKFDLIFLRQPNFFDQKDVFFTIIQDIIPHLMHSESRLFISTYHRIELEFVSLLIEGLYGIPESEGDSSSCTLNEQEGYLTCGVKLTPDRYSALLGAHPELKNQLKAEESPRPRPCEEDVSSMRLA